MPRVLIADDEESMRTLVARAIAMDGHTIVTAQDGAHPIQLITSLPCINQPEGTAACDHIEESVFPAETLGQHYIVTVPTSPGGTPIGHIVRVFGNVDGTSLTYSPSKPAGKESEFGVRPS